MTVVGGIFFLAPFMVLIIVLGKAQQITRAVVIPLAAKIPAESLLGFETSKLLAILILVLVCFLAGLFAKTAPAQKLVRWLETALLSNLPGYSFMKNMGEEVAGTAQTHRHEAVLVRFDDAWQVGFLVERVPGGRVVVFIPDSPSPWSGGVFIFNEERVTPLKVSPASALKCQQKLGEGTAALVNEISEKI